MSRNVVVTGLGIVSPIGNTVDETFASLKEGKCGIGPITHYDATDRKVKLAGEVRDLDLTKYIDKRDIRKMDRFTHLAVAAAVQAIEDAGIEPPAEDTPFEERGRWGVIIASGIGGISTLETEMETGQKKGFDRVSPFFIPKTISNMAGGQVAIRYGLHGMCSCTVSACSSAGNAIGDAFRHIKDGYGDLMVCGGAEAAVTTLSIGGFTSLKALTTESNPERASIPFDKERSGFVMGEGAGMLVLEEEEHAKARGAKIYGRMVGYGATCDGYHMTAPLPTGEGAAACMKQAMEGAGLTPADIDYINAHGTSTPLNDSGETLAIRKAFGAEADRLKVSSTKSMTGHLLGASAAIEAVITMLAVHHDFLPPTIHYQVPDEACNLDIVPNKGYDYPIRAAMSNSLGFGGHNVSLIFAK